MNSSREMYCGWRWPLFTTLRWLPVITLLTLHPINSPAAHLGSFCPIWADLFSPEWEDKGAVKKNCHARENILAPCLILLHFQRPAFSPLPWFFLFSSLTYRLLASDFSPPFFLFFSCIGSPVFLNSLQSNQPQALKCAPRGSNNCK